MVKTQAKYFNVKNLRIYQLATEVADLVWKVVQKWDWVAKRTVGTQWIDASDSISANITEGFGRFHKKDRIKFYLNARGSILESIDWAEKATRRKLLTSQESNDILKLLESLPREINYQIKFLKDSLTQ